MSQTIDLLIYMANQIAREFGAQRSGEAPEATYDHIWHFWDPRMCEMIIAHADAGGKGLSDTAKAAIDMLAHRRGDPTSVTRATEFDGGDYMSDAG